MLYDWIGEEAFKKGMHNYLTKYSYGNTETPQLWTELENASNLPVNKVMKSWTEQMGFPCIHVSSRQEGSERILTLTQSKFVGDGKSNDVAKRARWHIPVTISSAQGETVKVMMNAEEEQTVVKMNNVNASDWVKLNPSVIGFYRVHYNQMDLDLLCEAVKTKALPAIDRLNVLDDLFSLIAAGKSKTVDGLRLLKSYKNEDSYIVWNNISQVIGNLSVVISDTDFYAEWEKFILDLFSVVKSSVSWDPVEGESHLSTLLRSIVIGRLGKAGDQEIRQEAKRRFDLHVIGTSQINPDIRSAVYSIVGSIGAEDDYNTMVKLHEEAELHEEKARIARSGIAAFANKSLLAKALEFSISASVRAQDSVHMIGSVACRRQGRDLSWQFFKDNFVLLSERYRPGFLLSRLVQSCCSDFLTEQRAMEIEKFFADHPLPGSERNVAQAVETIRMNAAWLRRDLSDIANFFKQN